MKTKVYILAVLLFFVHISFAQTTGTNIDVKYHKIWWRINPDSSVKYIKGCVQTNFLTVTSVSTISFDINAVLIIDSVLFDGAKLPAGNITRAGNVMTIALGTTLPVNTLDSVWVYYRGTPPAISGAAEGYQLATDPTSGQDYIYTLSESYEDRDWWPCKANMQDKIDSIDIMVSTPWSGADTFWVATNGKLVDSTISGGNRTFTFENRSPMASYLVCVSVARYNRYYRKVNIGGTDVQVVYNLFRGKSASSYNSIISAMDKVNDVLLAFSDKFGDYPFKNEKHGFYEGLGGAGGMEHQTFSAIASNALTSQSTLCHELMHQWFGDKTTFATWADLWLAEGFARYGEALAGELVPATGLDPVAEMFSAKSSGRSLTTNRTRITSYANSAQVWSNANVKAVYDRGCMVVSMLRALSGDDNFFRACKNYLDSANGSGYKSATTDSLKNFNAVLDYDLTPFFNDWVIGQGHPTTVVNWNTPVANKLLVSIGSQTKSTGASAGYFHNVIILRAQAPGGYDTTIVIYDIDGDNLAKAGLVSGIGVSVPGNLLSYDLSFTPFTVTFDAFNQTMSAGSTVKSATLDLKVLNFTARKIIAGNDLVLSLLSTDAIAKVELQKSIDGVGFITAGQMNIVSLHNQIFNYQLTDDNPFSPTTFYRAKIYYAGKYELTNVVKISAIQINTTTVSPNPANDKVKINFDNPFKEEILLAIFNVEGKKIIETKTKNNFIYFNVSNLQPGIYLLQIMQKGEMAAVSKLLVHH
jgi:Peptidase family M1 domain/Secretion system C-terminal sorting domain